MYHDRYLWRVFFLVEVNPGNIQSITRTFDSNKFVHTWKVMDYIHCSIKVPNTE